MLIHITGLPATVSQDDDASLRREIEDKVAQIIGLKTTTINPIFVETFASRSDSPRGLFAGVRTVAPEDKAQIMRAQIETAIVEILHEFVKTRYQSIWMIGVYFENPGIALSEFEL